MYGDVSINKSDVYVSIYYRYKSSGVTGVLLSVSMDGIDIENG